MPKKRTISSVFALACLSVALTACQSTAPKPDAWYTPALATKDSQVLEILPTRTSCNSGSPMQCLLVKPLGTGDGEIFGIGFNDIKGFEPRAGIYYKIRASQEYDQNTGELTGLWQLDEILSQSK
ncbi:DUF4377 domain-containing protein [Moraxella sp. ZJ142]